MDRAAAQKRSLAIPANTPPADYKAYVEHPEVATLNQIMLHYLEMEEILKLYRQNHEQFETRQALYTLTERFKLPAATDFKQLLRAYDMKYATVRSYLYNNRTPKKILMQAALEGNIQAFYNQLKLYPELRNEEIYTRALGRAAQGGHEVIIELLFDLGAVDKNRSIFEGAVLGRQVALMQKELAKGIKLIYIYYAVNEAASHSHKDVVAALLDYCIKDRILDNAMVGAGQSGDINMIDYVISRGGTAYKKMINAAAIYQHLHIIRHYWHKLTKNHIKLNDRIIVDAINGLNLEMVKFVVEKKLADLGQLSNNLEDLKRRRGNLLASKRRIDKQNKLSRLNMLSKLNNQQAAIDMIIAYLERVLRE